HHKRYRGLCSQCIATAEPAHSVSARLLHFVGGAVPISGGGQGAAQDRDPLNAANHFRAPLHEHEIVGENCNCVTRGAVLVDRRFLVSLHPWLQYERRRLGWTPRPCWTRRRDGC